MSSTRGPVVARIPGSKSITARALICAAAADGVSTLRNPLVADDTVAMLEALRTLGYDVVCGEGDGEWVITGSPAGPPQREAGIDCHDAGTVARFLPALVAAGHGTYTFDGSAQLRARPLHTLLDALRALGAAIPGDAGSLPFGLDARGLRGGQIRVPSTVSSQFLSALCMAAPLARSETRLEVQGLVSRPYVAMTRGVMERFGVDAVWQEHEDGALTIAVAPQGYRARAITIEPDASSASYFFAAAALCGTSVTVEGLGGESLQGDIRFVEILREMGAEVTLDAHRTTVRGSGSLRGAGTVSMTDISDTMMTLAAIAPLATSPTRIEGIGNARVKESDRIAAVAANLLALGVRVRSGSDWLEIWPSPPRPAQIRCHRDHRIAMAFSVTALRAEGITLDDPSCVAKTFPGFHQELARVISQWATSRTPGSAAAIRDPSPR